MCDLLHVVELWNLYVRRHGSVIDSAEKMAVYSEVKVVRLTLISAL